jgi:hypothetical protein
MHYTRKYSGTHEQRTDQAVQDCKEWLGLGYNAKISLLAGWFEDCREEGTKKSHMARTLAMIASLSGIKGYWPVRALARESLRLCRQREAQRKVQS